MIVKACRKFNFCSGHRVYGHESKCANMHGHNYTLTVYAESEQLDALGRVIDFSELKKKIGQWLDHHWDHTFLIYSKDQDLLQVDGLIPKSKPWFICPFNPTAENMAIHLLKDVIPVLLEGTGIRVTKLELWETENCKVEIIE